MTVMALAFAQVWAVEAVDPEEEAARQVDETMRQVNQARSTWNVERAFCFRVVDVHRTTRLRPAGYTDVHSSQYVAGSRHADWRTTAH